MSIMSTTNVAAAPLGPRYIFNWFFFHFGVYFSVAVLSVLLFFAGAFFYVHLWSDAPSRDIPHLNISIPNIQKPSSPDGPSELMVSLPSGQSLPVSQLYKRPVADDAGSPVGYIVGFAITNNTPNTVVLSVQDNGSNKTVGLPVKVLEVKSPRPQEPLQINLSRESIVTSPAFANVGGAWKPATENPPPGIKR